MDYEACITYHIVRYCEEKQMGRIFPFGISQIQEKKEGYGFGYQMESQNLFFEGRIFFGVQIFLTVAVSGHKSDIDGMEQKGKLYRAGGR